MSATNSGQHRREWRKGGKFPTSYREIGAPITIDDHLTQHNITTSRELTAAMKQRRAGRAPKRTKALRTHESHIKARTWGRSWSGNEKKSIQSHKRGGKIRGNGPQ